MRCSLLINGINTDIVGKAVERASGQTLEAYLRDHVTGPLGMTDTAFTLSDAFVISRHGDDFRQLIANGEIDILFANEHELAALTGLDDFEAGIVALAPKVPVLVVTRSEKGAVAVAAGERADVPAQPVARVLDTTGAGDLFAAGFLFGHVRGRSLADSLKLGAICAAEIISHYGARPEADLQELAAQQLA